jgi:hypothetical protein
MAPARDRRRQPDDLALEVVRQAVEKSSGSDSQFGVGRERVRQSLTVGEIELAVKADRPTRESS